MVLEFYIDFVMLLNNLLPHHDSKSNGLKSETNRNQSATVKASSYKHQSNKDLHTAKRILGPCKVQYIYTLY
jgi:hypothetical protein